MSEAGFPAALKYFHAPSTAPALAHEAEVAIYGANAAGVAAAIQVARMGKSVVLLEFGRHLGGLTSGGLGATDIGNKLAIGGISREFYRRLGQHYGTAENWTFEPSVAEATLRAMLAEAGVVPHFEHQLDQVRMAGGRITELTFLNGSTCRAKVFIDCSYEGDLMAKAGCAYTVGREGNERYDEAYNGVAFCHPSHNFITFVDPYRTPGEPASGLLPGVFPNSGPQGAGDNLVQAYCFRLCLTDRADIKVAFPKPANYDADRHELLLRYLQAGVFDVFGLTKRMPNGKTDTNNFGAYSMDNIGMNTRYPDGDYATREAIFQDHVTYQAGMLYFLANDPRVPLSVRDKTRTWGLAGDEFTDTGHWPRQLYVREARRLVGPVVMTEHHCLERYTVEDSIGLAAYGIDSHHCNRTVRAGRAMNEGNVEFRVPAPFPVSYRAITPHEQECTNLLVPVCLSASHPAYGSIRMEPVFMILGQSAATAAVLTAAGSGSVQALPYAELEAQLRKDRQLLG